MMLEVFLTTALPLDEEIIFIILMTTKIYLILCQCFRCHVLNLSFIDRVLHTRHDDQ